MDNPKSPTSTPATPGAGVATAGSTNVTGATLQRAEAMTAIRQAYQKNFEMMTQVTQTLTTGAASVFQNQQNMLRNAMAQAGTTAQERIAACAPQHCPEAIDRHKQAVDAGLANIRKIAEVAEQSKSHAFNLVQKTINERLQQRGQPMAGGLLANSPEKPAGTSPQRPKSTR
jgi:hypothetical protein